MKTFRSYIKENMLDSDREVNYYNALARERMNSMLPPEPKYHKAFLGKTNSVERLDEVRIVRDYKVSDKIHDPDQYNVLDNEEAPNEDDIAHLDKMMSNHTLSIPHSDDHQEAVRRYTDVSYVDINSYLYGNKSELTNPYNQNHIDNLKGLINRSRAPSALTVFTGIKRDPNEYKSEDNAKYMINPAFTSTSLAHSQAKGFATKFLHQDEDGYDILNPENGVVNNKHIIRLSIPQGAHGYYTDPYSTIGDEKEFVLHPGSRFKIWHKPLQFVDKWDRNTIYNHWYGRLVHDGIKDHPIPENDMLHPKNMG
jgi:hypothetical protein